MTVEAKVAQTAMKVASQTAQQGAQTPLTGDQSQFMSILENHEVSMDAANADMMKALGYNPDSHPANNAIPAQSLQIQVGTVEQLNSVQSTDKVTNMLSELNRGGLQMQKVMEMKISIRILLALNSNPLKWITFFWESPSPTFLPVKMMTKLRVVKMRPPIIRATRRISSTHILSLLGPSCCMQQ